MRLGYGASTSRSFTQVIKYFRRNQQHPANAAEAENDHLAASGVVICSSTECQENVATVGKKRKGGRPSTRVWMKWSDFIEQMKQFCQVRHGVVVHNNDLLLSVFNKPAIVVTPVG